jgi:hypothetical protein
MMAKENSANSVDDELLASEFERDFDDFDAEFRELERQSARFPMMIVAIFLGIGVLTLAIALTSGFSAARQIAAEQPAPGRIFDLILRTSPGGYDSEGNYQPPQDYYYPVVEFSLPNGDQVTVQLSEGSWPAAYTIGEEVTIIYNPDRPTDARIQSASSNFLVWLLPGLTGLLGVAFLAAAGLVYWFTRPAAPDIVSP